MTLKRVLPLLLAAAALGCAKPLPEVAPLSVSPLTLSADEWRVTDYVFVVTDSSGTMYVNETFPEAKSLSRSFVASMPEKSARARQGADYQAAVIGFGGDERIETELSAFDRSTLSSRAQQFRILGAIDGTGGRTPFDAIFDEITGQMKGKGRTAVVIFSDGMADNPERAIASAKKLINAGGGDVCFHAVQTGSEPAGREFFTQLSGLTRCGSFKTAADVNSPQQLASFTRTVFTGPSPLPPVAADPCAGVVRLQGIEFGFDRYDVTDDSAVVLDAAVEILKDCGDIALNVDGHTDWTGPDEYNQGLSERRAGAVKEYLSGAGISGSRLAPRGFGESDPIASNETRDGRARNRRVELNPQ